VSLNKTGLAILGILSRGPQTGYDVKKVFSSIAGHFWQASYGQIYPLLKKLNAQGLVKHKTHKPNLRQAKNIYALTAQGRKSLRHWLRSPVESHPWRIEILLRLFFGRQVPVAENIRQIEIYRRHKQDEILRLEEIERHLREEHAEDPDQPYYLLTVDYGQKVVRACLDWCEQSLARLRELEKQGYDKQKAKPFDCSNCESLAKKHDK